jgi:hypothetical protein
MHPFKNALREKSEECFKHEIGNKMPKKVIKIMMDPAC